MKLAHQRILYAAFVLAFLIFTPLIVLYSSGFRYNFIKNRIEQTGILVIQSEPSQATILLNDELKGLTPGRFTNLLPDAYKVSVTKSGYHPWHRTIQVVSQLTSFAQKIVLFRQQLPTLEVETAIGIFASSSDNRRLVYSRLNATEEELFLFSFANNQHQPLLSFDRSDYDRLEFVAWSPDNNRVLLREYIDDTSHYGVINLVNNTVKDINDITRLNFTQVEWDQDNNDIIYGLSRAVLHRIDLVSNAAQRVASADILDFLAKGQTLYYIAREPDGTYLYQTESGGTQAAQPQKIKLPSPSTFHFDQAPDGMLALIDSQNQELFLLDSDVFDGSDVSEHIQLQGQASRLIWSPDEQQVLLVTDFEISHYDIRTQALGLLTRYGRPITDVFWHPGQGHVIYRVGEEIRVTEVIADQRNDFELARITQINGMAVDAGAESLIIAGRVSDKTGLYRLILE